MYVSLYRRYRPQNFSDVVGQTAAVSVLQQSLNEKRIGHAYLFSGPRGCGKTSIARILAKALNCLSPKDNCEPCCECANCSAIAAGEHLDVIEIDGASNRGINEIRDLKSRVNLRPLNAVYKIYIIDEVHMLTEQAFNALLKTLEEPPSNVVFILATTEPNKVPVTIRSRCQHIPFHRISMADLVKRVAYICEREGISAEKEAIWEIARQADGALRDALSITEQAVALGNGSLTLESLKGLLGGSSRTELEELVTLLRAEPEAAAKRMHEVFSRGVSVETFAEALFNIYRDLWMYSLWKERCFEALEVSEAEHAWIAKEAADRTSEQLKAACAFCNKLMPRAKYGMKTEIFMGLVLLGLTKTNEQRTAAQPAEDVSRAVEIPQPVQHVVSAASGMQPLEETAAAAITEILEKEKSAEAITENMPQQFAEPVNSAPVAEKAEEAAEQHFDNSSVPFAFETSDTENYDAAELCAKLRSVNELYAGMTDAFSAHKLELSAALLDAEIVNDTDGWKLEFVRNGKNAALLKKTENSEILANAVNSVFGVEKFVGTEEDKPEIPAVSQKPVLPQQNVQIQPQPVQTKTAQPADASMDRMLKLIGADVLYVEEENSEDRESDTE